VVLQINYDLILVTPSNYVIKMTSQNFSIFKPPLSKVLVALLISVLTFRHSLKIHYNKSKLELKSNLSDVLSINCKFICASTPT